MPNSIFSVAMTCLLLLAGNATAQEVGERAPYLPKLVQSLGINADKEGWPDPVDVIEVQLAEHPRQAVKLLVRELHTVPLRAIHDPESEEGIVQQSLHVVWCLRALTYLTGREFKARTTEQIIITHDSISIDSDEELESLDQVVQLYGRYPTNSQTKVPIPFCREWMTHRKVLFAPVDAQVKIIKAWNQWQKRNGDTFRPAKGVNRKKWLF